MATSKKKVCKAAPKTRFYYVVIYMNKESESLQRTKVGIAIVESKSPKSAINYCLDKKNDVFSKAIRKAVKRIDSYKIHAFHMKLKNRERLHYQEILREHIEG